MSNRILLPLLSLAAYACAAAPPPAQLPVPSGTAPAAVVERPLPQAVEVHPAFTEAVRAGTRTTTGRPGARYWQNRESYRLTATLDAERRVLRGTARIGYRNNSPDTLANLHLELAQNLHAAGAVRFEEAEVTDGVQLTRLAVNGVTLGTEGQGARYAVFGTRLVILPPAPVLPGGSAEIDVEWSFTIPQAGAGERMGWGDDLFFLAYWYPKMVVYDDIVGWHPDPFVATTEFYHGFGRYELTVDAPAGWVIMATGRLTNPQEVLAPAVLQRMEAAAQSDTPVAILREAEFARATRTTSGRLRWHFVSDSVRDVAFSATRASNWDGMRTAVGDRTGDGVTDYTAIHSFWRPRAPRWAHVARYSAHSISFLSQYLDFPYPWPHMTAVEGGEIIGGGMEFPMMTLMGDYNARGDSALYYVTAHELAHMWMPMIVSNDERRYTWMDEGTTTYNENTARMDFFPGRNHYVDDQLSYLEIANSGEEGEIMRRSAFHYTPTAYVIASYMKPGSVLLALRGVLGDEVFHRGLHEFFRRWQYRHPYPWDMWNTFADVSGRDLDWFWRSWYFETWALDQAVAAVTARGGTTHIVIEDRGQVPMPVHLTVTFADGRSERHDVPVEHWLAGNRRATVTVATGNVVRVEIDAAMMFPDADRANNVWSR